MIWERPCFREECSFRDQLSFLVAFLLTGAFWKAIFSRWFSFCCLALECLDLKKGKAFPVWGSVGVWHWKLGLLLATSCSFWNDMKLFMYILLNCDFLCTGDAFIFQTVRVSYLNFLMYNVAKILSCFSWSQMCMFIFSAGSVVYYFGQNTGIILRTL